MREAEFRRFLCESVDIVSKEKAVATRVSKALAVEKELNVNLDAIVKSDDETYQLLLLIRKQMNEVNGGYQNAVRKYYLFVNGKEFPRINEYEKKVRMNKGSGNINPMTFNLAKTPIQLVHDSGEVLEGYDLVEGEGLCCIYNHQEERFEFVCTRRGELHHLLTTHSMDLKLLENK